MPYTDLHHAQHTEGMRIRYFKRMEPAVTVKIKDVEQDDAKPEGDHVEQF